MNETQRPPAPGQPPRPDSPRVPPQPALPPAETIGRFNYGFRTAVYMGVVLLIGWGAWSVHSAFTQHEEEMQAAQATISDLHQDVAKRDQHIAEQDQHIAEQDQQIAELKQEIQRLQTALRLLKVDHRLARLTVLEQKAAPDKPGGVQTRVSFQELDDQDQALGPAQEYTLDGKVAYVDALVIKFDDSYVEQGDTLRGTSLCLFRRIFGEFQQPNDGFPLDTAGQRPRPYGSGDDPGFESRLWARFWDYAHDPQAVAAAGVRALHGEAPYMELRDGRSYRIELRASGGLSIRPDAE
jgi:hypothetical protein